MKSPSRVFSRTRTFVIGAALALAGASALAIDVLPLEVDGGVMPSTSEDWQTLFGGGSSAVPFACNKTGTGAGTAEARGCTSERAQPTATIFTGGGSKDGLDIGTWRWTTSNVPDKDNLMTAFSALYTAPPGSRSPDGCGDPSPTCLDITGHKILYFGADRYANNGDAQIGFWFFQHSVSPLTGGTFKGKHAVGDLLVLSNFTNGGTTTNFQALVVTGISASGALTFGVAGSAASGLSYACNTADSICVATNAIPTPSLDPDYDDKFGTAKGTYAPVTFFEGGLDLTAAGLGSECLSSYLAETRSSQSIDAVLKDFALGSLQNCSADTRTEIYVVGDPGSVNVDGTTIPSGSTIVDKIFVKGDPGKPGVGGTATFQYFANGSCQAPATATDSGVTLVPGLPDATGIVSTALSSQRGPLASGAYSFLATYNGDDPNYPDTATSNCETVAVSTPSISVSKTCGAVVNTDGTSVTVSFSGQVCANGDEDLHNVALTDDLGGITVAPSSTIARGACSPYSGSYVATSASNSDTVTATGLGAGGTQVQSTATASCSATVTPAITISKACTAAVNGTGAGVDVSFNGQVCNTGNAQLSGIFVVDNQPTNGTSVAFSPTTLAPGACAPYSGSYASTSAVNNDTVTANATGALGSGTVTNTGSASCTATLTPAISITKTCSNILSLAPNGHLEVKVNVGGEVCNTGNVQVTNVRVTDNMAGQLISGTTLALGQCAPYVANYYPASLASSSGTATDTVTATGTGAVGSGAVSDQRSASCNLCLLPSTGAH